MAECSNVAVGEEAEEEEVYLCKLFGDDGRFVQFVNLTGRPVRLTSRLHMENFSNMAWSTTIIIPEGGKHVWRFLGDSQNLSLSFLSMLPDPYTLARRNSYRWTVEYIDSQEDDNITFDNKEGPLSLQTMNDILPRETTQVMLRRRHCDVAPLRKLAKDAIVKSRKVPADQMSFVNIPKILQEELAVLGKDYQEMERVKVDPCVRCGEIHQ